MRRHHAQQELSAQPFATALWVVADERVKVVEFRVRVFVRELR